jgi:hypothetical protein
MSIHTVSHSFRILRIAALLPVLVLGACNGSDDFTSPTAGPDLANLGLVSQATTLAADGHLLLVAASEAQAGRDLNADGDAFDHVLYVLDLDDGSTVALGLALDTAAPDMLAVVRGELVLFAVSEQASGARDQNGDGDANDRVAFLYDARNGSTRGLGFALSLAGGANLALDAERAAFVASELDQESDLDGDGQRGSHVLFVYDVATRAFVNSGLDTPSPLFLEDGAVAFFRNETATDQNGDGDLDDRAVLQVFDATTLALRNSALATDGGKPVFAGGTWLVGVPELAQRSDLDGDGLRASVVVHAFDPDGTVRNLGVACIDVPCARAAPAGVAPLFALRVAEAGRADLNLDGDVFDVVAALYDPLAARFVNVGVASATPPLFAGGVLAFLASESANGRDLDDDGDTLDVVAVVADLATGTPTSTGQDALALQGSDEFLLLARSERNAAIDWNVDGDLADVVVHVFDPRKSTTTNTGVASAGVFGASASSVLFSADEAGEEADLNGDGDRVDAVFTLFDLAAQSATSLFLAGGVAEARFGFVSAKGTFALLANERAQGRDMDGDGDLADDVLHRGE